MILHLVSIVSIVSDGMFSSIVSERAESIPNNLSFSALPSIITVFESLREPLRSEDLSLRESRSGALSIANSLDAVHPSFFTLLRSYRRPPNALPNYFGQPPILRSLNIKTIVTETFTYPHPNTYRTDQPCNRPSCRTDRTTSVCMRTTVARSRRNAFGKYIANS
jgi:hypothetical protein